MTYKQFTTYKPKNVLKLLLKYRDYKLAMTMVDILGLKQLQSVVYEDWCISMLKYSTLPDPELLDRLTSKFDSLSQRIA